MSIRDIASVITPPLLLIAFCAFSLWKSDQEVAAHAIELSRAAQDGREWMEDTTAKLEATLAGIEQITGETLQLSQRVDDLADRLDRAEL